MIQSKIGTSFSQLHCDADSRCYPRCCDASWNFVPATSPCGNFVRSSGGDRHLTLTVQKPRSCCESLRLKSIFVCAAGVYSH